MPAVGSPAENVNPDETVFVGNRVRRIQEALSQVITDATRLQIGHVLNGRFVLAEQLAAWTRS